MSLPKKSKVNLPKDWIVVNSTSFPDRVYYFNVRNGKSSWKEPREETNKQKPGKPSQKRKLLFENERDDIPTEKLLSPSSSTTPEKVSERRILRAKRPSEPLPPKVKETPQMKEMRQKLLEKKQSKTLPNEKLKPRNLSSENRDDKVQKFNKGVKPIPQKRFPRSQSSIDAVKPVNRVPETRNTPNVEEFKERKSVSSGSSISSKNSTPGTPRNRNEQRTDTSKSNSGSKNSILKKNLANKRLDSLKKCLKNERKKIEPAVTAEIALRMLSQDSEQTKSDTGEDRNAEIVLEDPKSPIELSPNISRNAESRFKNLKGRVTTNLTSSQVQFNKDNEQLNRVESKAPKIPKTNKKNVKKGARGVTAGVKSVIGGNEEPGTSGGNPVAENRCRNDSFWEEMEWEPIEEEKVIFEIQEVRTQLSTDQGSQQKVPDCTINGLELSQVSQNTDKRILYVVVDTNVYLSNLKIVTELLEASGKINGHYKPVVVVPWTVLQELDYIKDNKLKTKSSHLQRSAKVAVDMLFQYFSSNHPRLKGQTAGDAASNRTKFQVESRDDEILQSCLQIRELGYTVVLLSNDKNLCNKAMVNNIQTYGMRQSIDDILSLNRKKLQSKLPVKELWPIVENRVEEEGIIDDGSKESEISDDIYCEAKAIMKNFLSIIVSKEMENLYGENWRKYTIVQPPWSVNDVFKCTLKHWIAAISDVFFKQAESLVSKLSKMFLDAPKYGQSLKHVCEVLELCNDLVQMMKSKDYQELSEKTCCDIKELMKNCKEKLKEVEKNGNRNQINFIETENNNLNDEERANNAFKYFEQIWTFTNNFCGLTADSVGIPHSITYKTSNQALPLERINQIQPGLISSLNKLIHSLRTVLNDDESVTADHPAVISLYQILINYYPNSDELKDLRYLDIIDLLCCIKVKKEFLKTGLIQLQELSYQFCRIADFQSTINIAIT